MVCAESNERTTWCNCPGRGGGSGGRRGHTELMVGDTFPTLVGAGREGGDIGSGKLTGGFAMLHSVIL
jgi:hypothetical protein